jgi:single-strand selective monofunctional uracil DNA glycosylase
MSLSPAEGLLLAARELAAAAGSLKFSPPVSLVYNPLVYAWPAHELYLRKFGGSPKRVVFLGMNPGPFGMTQTGVPFGEVAAVRHWLGLRASTGKPEREHPQRPITGFDCARSEVSGRRLWGLFADRFGAAEEFFREHFVLNYCPLAFVEASGRNRTPDKLKREEKASLFGVCDEHLRRAIRALQPEWVIGIGDFAAQRARAVFQEAQPRVGRILHPSPASPLANRDWPKTAAGQLEALGVWRKSCCAG